MTRASAAIRASPPPRTMTASYSTSGRLVSRADDSASRCRAAANRGEAKRTGSAAASAMSDSPTGLDQRQTTAPATRNRAAQNHGPVTADIALETEKNTPG